MKGKFGTVTDEDREAYEMLERVKSKPLSPPPALPPPALPPGDIPENSYIEVSAKSKDGDSDADFRNDDLLDCKREVEEIVEAKKREEERLRQLEEKALKSSSDHVTNGTDRVESAGEESGAELKDAPMEEDSIEDSYSGHENHDGSEALQNRNNGDEPTMASVALS